MPNTTSYTGSWMIWFAERQLDSGAGGALSAPLPVRKVDPKYYQAAVADRVEGTVRLTAVIRKDGPVDSITLLQHLDDRLDQSAQEAMDKWQLRACLARWPARGRGCGDRDSFPPGAENWKMTPK